jgi:hypothetical protein
MAYILRCGIKINNTKPVYKNKIYKNHKIPSMTPLQKAQQIEFEKVQENELMKRFNARRFFKFYYQECKNFETNKQAFDHTNEMYFDLFGQSLLQLYFI